MNVPLPNDEFLTAYLDNELSQEDRVRVEQRLATDSEYAATLDAFQDVRKRLQALPKGSIDVRQRVMDRVGEQSRVATGRRKSNWQAAAWAIASLAALLLLGLFLYLPERASDFAVVQNEATSVEETAVGDEQDEIALALKDESVAELKMQDVPPPAPQAAKPEIRLSRSVTADRSEPTSQASGQSIRSVPRNDRAVAAKKQSAAAAASQPTSAAAERSQEELESQLMDDAFLRRRSAPSAAAGSVPTRSSQAEGPEIGKSFKAPVAGVAPFDRDEEQAADLSTIDKLTIEGALTGKDLLKRLEKRPYRIWMVDPTSDQSDERLTLARFRRALEQAGCDYRVENPLRPLSQSGIKSEPDRIAKGKQGIDLIVVAAPEQLVKLRKLAKQFSSMSRVDITMRSTRGSMSQEDWDGSRLPRDDGLDPQGDGRTYLFWVTPEKEPPANP